MSPPSRLEAHQRVLGVERRAVEVRAREVHGILRRREHGAHAARVLDRERLLGVEAELTELGRHAFGADEAWHQADDRDVVRSELLREPGYRTVEGRLRERVAEAPAALADRRR